MRTTKKVLPVGVLVLLSVVSGCAISDAPEGEEVFEDENELGRTSSALASVMGGMEVGIDAPWRLEPIGSDIDAHSNVYPPIPIVVSVHDANMQRDADTFRPIGRFCGVSIHEYWADGNLNRYHPLGDRTERWSLDTWIPANSPLVREIERSGTWQYNSDFAAGHRVCRRWRGESCETELDASQTAEWHATIAYHPQQYASGGDPDASAVSPLRNNHDVRLLVTASFARTGQTCDDNSGKITFRDYLSVHLGDALPRFGPNWVYGDLHYHSQGTDNEGESGYAYRPTLQVMRAMGLDFVFATEHASDSGQVTDMDPIFIDHPPDIPLAPRFLEEWAADMVNKKLSDYDVLGSVEARRDMSPARFVALQRWLSAGNGANAEVLLAFPGGSARAPRIFLGGEVDVIPEIDATERANGYVYFGNGAAYPWTEACTQLPAELLAAGKYTTIDTCPGGAHAALLQQVGGQQRWMVRDLQGLLERHFARQHLVYLPIDNAESNRFVSSHSSVYGGATMRLANLLDPAHPETLVGKGYAFLAHPVDFESGNTPARLGPDIVPYSDAQLKTAFASPQILGLELWNEDSRLESSPDKPGFGFVPPPAGTDALPREWGEWKGPTPPAYRELHHGLFAWDKMLQWGLRPSQTSSLAWLGAGEPRRVFIAGGSDAHGDLNYRRQGRLEGTSAIVDTALGKPRNLVNVGNARPDSVQTEDSSFVPAIGQTQVVEALRRGDFSVTDGPALRIAIDRNGNGVIDDGDTPMGGVTNPIGGKVNVIVEWRSSPEFGPVGEIDLYVGAADPTTDISVVYAPEYHGVHGPGTPSGAPDPRLYRAADGTAHRKLFDGYMAGPSWLRILPAASNAGYVGRRTIVIDPNQFPTGTAKLETTATQVCDDNIYCRKYGPNHPMCSYECRTQTTSTPVFENKSIPTRLYVRAFAKTLVTAALCNPSNTSAEAVSHQKRGECIERLAFTNPVWIVPYVRPGTIFVPPPPGGGVFAP